MTHRPEEIPGITLYATLLIVIRDIVPPRIHSGLMRNKPVRTYGFRHVRKPNAIAE